jgi:hypothetical protein
MMRHEGLTGDQYDLGSSTGIQERYPYKWVTAEGASNSSKGSGQWSSGLCACMEKGCLSSCWAAFCCMWIPVGQLYEKVLTRGCCPLVSLITLLVMSTGVLGLWLGPYSSSMVEQLNLNLNTCLIRVGGGYYGQPFCLSTISTVLTCAPERCPRRHRRLSIQDPLGDPLA